MPDLLIRHRIPQADRAAVLSAFVRTHPNITIQTCWDSDRLDLGRIGIMPHASRLSTEVAKKPETIKWADGRASFGVVPDFVTDEWGIELETPW